MARLTSITTIVRECDHPDPARYDRFKAKVAEVRAFIDGIQVETEQTSLSMCGWHSAEPLETMLRRVFEVADDSQQEIR